MQEELPYKARFNGDVGIRVQTVIDERWNGIRKNFIEKAHSALEMRIDTARAYINEVIKGKILGTTFPRPSNPQKRADDLSKLLHFSEIPPDDPVIISIQQNASGYQFNYPPSKQSS